MATYHPQIDSFRTKEAMRFLLNLLRNLDASAPSDNMTGKGRKNKFRRRVRPREGVVGAEEFFAPDCGETSYGASSSGVRIDDEDVFTVPAGLVTNDRLHEWYVATIPASVRKRAEERRRGDPVVFDDNTDELLRCLWCDGAIRPKLVEYLASLPIPESDGDVFETNFKAYGDMLRLGDLDRDLLMVCYLLWTGKLVWPFRVGSRACSDRVKALAMYVDRSMEEVRAALLGSSPLLRYGCLDGDLDFRADLASHFDGLDKAPPASRFYRLDTEKPLPWDWFGPLASRHAAILRRMLTRRSGPANILLYGVPGTGKTSFARALAAETGRECLFVAQLRDSRRLGAVHACDLAVDPARSLIVVDEADSLLNQFGGSSRENLEDDEAHDKGALNALLDELHTPVVWICNANPRRMDDSNLRRFAYSVRFDAPTVEQRTCVWRNQAEKAGLRDLIPDALCADFAARWPVSAGGIASVLGTVASLRPEPTEVPSLVESLMKPHCELLGIDPQLDDRLRPAKDYSLEGLALTSSVPLSRIVEAARGFRREIAATADAAGGGIDQPRFNLLLSGPPGTGKTEFVKYLGAELGAKVVVKMGSDLLSMFVGGTEARIAAAFREAEGEDAILFLDEVDGLLRSRAMAQNSWEVTQVNELLHQMENFRGILVCATNFVDNLDPATVRRFTFKVTFDYLSAEGKALFFERMFGRTLTEGDRATLEAIPNLAPGDFRTVRQSMRYLGEAADNAALLSALRDESNAKRLTARSGGQGHIGF